MIVNELINCYGYPYRRSYGSAKIRETQFMSTEILLLADETCIIYNLDDQKSGSFSASVYNHHLREYTERDNEMLINSVYSSHYSLLLDRPLNPEGHDS